MKKNTYWKLVGLVVVVAGIALLAGCAEAGAGGGGGGNDGATAAEASAALSTAFGEFNSGYDAYYNDGQLPSCITVDDQSSPVEVVFDNCDFDGITIDGMVTISPDSGVFTIAADLTLGGTDVSSLEWSIAFDLTQNPMSISGSVTADGSTFTYAELGADLSDFNPPT